MKKIFRKIHLWLSVPFGLIITLVCFSGAMLVFENEVNEWFRRDLYYVETVKESPLSMDKLLEKVATTLPDSVSVTGTGRTGCFRHPMPMEEVGNGSRI